MFRLRMLITVFVVTGCAASESSTTAMNAINQRYTGQKADAFFLSYGKPASEATSDNGNKVYRWVSLEQGQTATVPPFQSFTSSSGKIHFAQPSMSGAQGGEQFCELNIETDTHGLIQHLSIIHDTPGRSSNSRCTELLAQP